MLQYRWNEQSSRCKIGCDGCPFFSGAPSPDKARRCARHEEFMPKPIDETEERTMLYYLPGCTTNRNHKQAGRKLLDYMRARGAKIAKCCKLDVDYYRDGDVAVQTCTQCGLILQERRPGLRVVSIYEFLADNPGFPFPDLRGKRLTVQDCFRTREDAPLQDAVRQCLKNMKAEIVEAKENRGDTKFCGVWLNSPIDKQCAALAPKTFAALEPFRKLLSPEEQKAAMTEWNKQYETEEVVVYCNGCEKGLRLGGGKPVHLIELLAAGL